MRGTLRSHPLIGRIAYLSQSAGRSVMIAASIAPVLTVGATAISMAQGPPPLALAERWSLGAPDRNDRLEFGNIEDIAVSEDGAYVFVLDRLRHRLTAFTEAGQLLGSAGRDGEGPGEFRWPSAVVPHDSGALVFDAMLGRVSHWVVRGNTVHLKSQRSSTTFLETRDACKLGASIVLLRLVNGRILHRVAPDGAVLRSFGLPFSPDRHPLMAAATTFGYLACESRTGSLYAAGSHVPLVRRYGEHGDLLWETSVPGISPPVIRAVGAGINYSRPDGRQHAQLVVSLVPLGDSMVAVQFGDEGPGITQPGNITAVHTVLLSAADGKVLWQGSSLPRLDLARGTRVYSHPNDPFPRVTSFEWSTRRAGSRTP